MPANKPLALVFDDDPGFALILGRTLERRGFEVVTYPGFEQFVSAERKRSRIPEISFVDLNIKRIGDGLAVVKALREDFKITTPIVMVSNTCKQPAYDYALRSGATDYLVKPISHYVLNRKLSRLTRTGKTALACPSLLPASCLGERVKIAVSFAIRAIDEFGVRLESSHLLKKNIGFMIQGGPLEEITGSKLPQRVHLSKIEFDTTRGQYVYHAAFDPTNIPLLTAVRRWLCTHVANSP